MTAAGIAVCAMFWGVSMASLVAVVIMYLCAKSERRELISRLYGNPPEEKPAPMPQRHTTAHERAIKRWRHKDDERSIE